MHQVFHGGNLENLEHTHREGGRCTCKEAVICGKELLFKAIPEEDRGAYLWAVAYTKQSLENKGEVWKNKRWGIHVPDRVLLCPLWQELHSGPCSFGPSLQLFDDGFSSVGRVMQSWTAKGRDVEQGSVWQRPVRLERSLAGEFRVPMNSLLFIVPERARSTQPLGGFLILWGA